MACSWNILRHCRILLRRAFLGNDSAVFFREELHRELFLLLGPSTIIVFLVIKAREPSIAIQTGNPYTTSNELTFIGPTARTHGWLRLLQFLHTKHLLQLPHLLSVSFVIAR